MRTHLSGYSLEQFINMNQIALAFNLQTTPEMRNEKVDNVIIRIDEIEFEKVTEFV